MNFKKTTLYREKKSRNTLFRFDLHLKDNLVSKLKLGFMPAFPYLRLLEQRIIRRSISIEEKTLTSLSVPR